MWKLNEFAGAMILLCVIFFISVNKIPVHEIRLKRMYL